MNLISDHKGSPQPYSMYKVKLRLWKEAEALLHCMNNNKTDVSPLLYDFSTPNKHNNTPGGTTAQLLPRNPSQRVGLNRRVSLMSQQVDPWKLNSEHPALANHAVKTLMTSKKTKSRHRLFVEKHLRLRLSNFATLQSYKCPFKHAPLTSITCG